MPSPLAPRLRRTTRHNWAAVVPYISKIKLSLDPTQDGTKGMRFVTPEGQSERIANQFPQSPSSASPECKGDIGALEHSKCPNHLIALQMRSFYPKCEIVMELKDGAHPEVAAEFGT